MKTLTATELARNFSRVLDDLEHGGEEIVVLRNHHPIARLIGGAPRLIAIEALGDLYRTLEDADAESWLADMRNANRLLAGEIQDPWA